MVFQLYSLSGDGRVKADSFLEEARLGFPEALPYEYDSLVGLTMEEAATQEEQRSTLIAEIGEKIIVYPYRMSQDHQDFFRLN